MSAKKINDLSAFDGLNEAQENGIDIEIKDPSGQPIGISIKIAGPDSSKQKKAVQALTNERLAAEDMAPVTAQDIETNTLKILASSVISWTPIVLDGADLPCSEENALRLFARFPFIREQVEKKAGKRAGFMKRS
ncbi:hypothetical protein [Phyllobacterium chamaecytisi]|uniref:hypothetical protein n=1 Tax=Phyllobacterium chamaecytisi TaxID=2876082 RepID=UPI001CCBC703|nr:hypothetical protein [Phyllobacterium sp. KW56]MBZ9600755.1 hypothetical protein [Phyllobacterium sp. KW56]